MIFFLFLISIAFIYFFYYIGLIYFSVIPILIILIVALKSLSYSGKNSVNTIGKVASLAKENLFFIARGLILIGLSGVIKYLGILSNIGYPTSWSFVFSLLFLLNIALYIFSYIFRYKDGEKIFHFGVYFSLLVVLLIQIKNGNFEATWNLIFLYSFFLLGVYAFINFVVGIYRERAKGVRFILFLFVIFCFLLFINNQVVFKELSVLISLLFIFFLFLFFLIIKKFYLSKESTVKPENKREKIIENILKNGKIEEETPNQKFDIESIYEFIINIPYGKKFIISFLNILLIFVEIYLFFMSFGTGGNFVVKELIYWSSIILFFVNFIFLKILDYPYYVNRIFAFLIVNLGIYLTIVNLFGENYMYIVIIGVIWNFLNNIFIFASKSLLYKKIFFFQDFIFWILANIIALFINIYFIFKLGLDFNLQLSLISLYIGIQFFLSIYNLSFIRNLE